ncbi:hypothetical protein D9611_001929 [Ephemerocybe angulata]|uniref:Uncharacterized protein n=1 Tax=Ephemerocybe angulata TaxID=980116 RepID=A0A8H5FM01_9AGAR|nr:hypothetical protein D9611_001929 [Tulosesus angulatus]
MEATRTMQHSERYPPPDPRDPFAPLWVLRSKSASTSARRPWTAEGASSASSRTTGSSSFVFPVAPPPDEFGYCERRPSTAASSVLLATPVTPRSPLTPALQATSPPTSFKSPHYLLATPPLGLSESPSPSPFDTLMEDADDQRTPVLGSRDHLGPDRAQKSRHSKLAKLFLGYKRPNSSLGMAVEKENAGHFALVSKQARPSSQPGLGRHQDRHHSLTGLTMHQQQHQEAASSNVARKTTISPPMASTVAWKSQVTGKFIPIAGSPVLNNTIPVQGWWQQDSDTNTATDTGPLDTWVTDASTTSSRHGRPTGNDVSAFDINPRKALGGSSPSPHLPPSPAWCRMQLDDSGVSMEDDARQTPVLSEESATLASPHGSHKKRASSQLAPIMTTKRQSSSTAVSSYIEIFTTPNASPRNETFGAMVSPTPPVSPKLPATPRVPTPNSLLLSVPLPTMATSTTSPQSASTTKAQCMCTSTIPIPQPPQAEWALPTKAQLAYAASLPIYQNDGTPIEFGTLFAEHRAIVLFLRHFFCPLCQDYVSSLASLVKDPLLRETGALCAYDEIDAKVLFVEGDEDGEGLLPRQVQLVMISCGKAALVDKYKDMFKLPFRMFTDPDMRVYEALGMGKMGDGGADDGGGGGVGGAANMGHTHGDGERPFAQDDNLELNGENKGRDGGYVKHGLMGGIAMVVLRALKVGMPVWANGGDIAQLGGEFVLGPGLTCGFAHRMQNPKGHAPVLDVLDAANVRIPEELAAGTNGDAMSRRSGEGRKVAVREGKQRKAKSLSISSRRDMTSSPLPHFQTASLNGHRPLTPKQLPSTGPSRAKQKRESFVTATLRSMGGNVPPGFENYLSTASQDTHETGSVVSSEQPASPQGYYANREFVPYKGSQKRPPSSRSHFDREQSWMESRQKDLEALRKRKDERRRTGKGSLSLSSRARSSGDTYQESISVDLSQLEFGAGSVESESGIVKGDERERARKQSMSTQYFTARSSTSTNRDFKAAVSSMELSLEDELELDGIGESGVVAVGGFISVPAPVRRRDGGGLGRVPKSVQAAIDLDLKGSGAAGKVKVKTKGRNGKGGSITAAMRSLWRG